MSTRVSIVAKDRDGTYEMSFSSKGEYASSFQGVDYKVVIEQIHSYERVSKDEESLDDDVYMTGLSEDEVIKNLSDYPDYVIYSEKGALSMLLSGANDYAKKVIGEIFNAGGIDGVRIEDEAALTFSYLTKKYIDKNPDDISSGGNSANVVSYFKDNGLLDTYDKSGKVEQCCLYHRGSANLSCQLEVALLDSLAATNQYY